jgi:hypothetical protein
MEQTLLLLPSIMLEDKGCGGSHRLFGLIAIEVWSVKVIKGVSGGVIEGHPDSQQVRDERE